MQVTRLKPFIVVSIPGALLLWLCIVQFNGTGDDRLLNDPPVIRPSPRARKNPSAPVEHEGVPAKTQRAKEPKIILFWTSFFGARNSYLGEEGERLKICPISECILTDDKSLWNSSDALIFHPLDFNAGDLPPIRHPHQYYVYFILESPHHSNTGPRGFFNLTFTYRLDSDIIADNYLQYFRPSLWTGTEDFEAVWRRKSRGVAMFASNCAPPSDRQHYVAILQRFMAVDVFGSCGNGAICGKESKEKCDSMVRQYKFYLAFENSICRDYVSEKAMRPYAADTVPVFLGGANYSAIFPADSFIDVRDFKSPKHLANHLKYLAGNKDAYAAYFKFRHRPPANPHNGLPSYLAPENVSLCKLCRMLHTKKRLHRVHRDLESWWVTEAHCEQPNWNAKFAQLDDKI